MFSDVVQISETSNRYVVLLGEEVVLVQVIKSIIGIIKQDPPSHENVSLSVSSSSSGLYLCSFLLILLTIEIY